MGWASYFEDIGSRYTEAHFSAAVVGPAGTPPPQISPALAASYHRLAAHYKRLRPDIVQRYQDEKWLALSVEMDVLAQEVQQFDRSTLLATERDLCERAKSISHRIDSVLRRARSILGVFNDRFLSLQAELDQIQVLKQQVVGSAIPEQDRGLEDSALWVMNGWRAFQAQTEDLEERANVLQVQLFDDVFDRLISSASARTIDKDADPEDN